MGPYFFNFLSSDKAVRDTPASQLVLLKIYIWEAQTFFDNPQLGIPELFVLREISRLEVR